jgi:glutamine amidotransferase
MVGRIETLGREAGTPESVWMTVAVSDGQRLWAARYASDGEAPTLHVSRDVEEVYCINPMIRGRMGDAARIVTSEPIGRFPEMWESVPQASALSVEACGSREVRPFRPAA